MSKGFSLVELSIVLVILGLLTGGILTGQNLIRAAELRAVTTEFSAFQTAVNTFRDKYFALPGDMPNATDFWGEVGDGGNGNSCTSAWSSDENNVGQGTETCNGNGNGIVDVDGNNKTESFRFWQHLANAGLIDGNYVGVGNIGTSGSGGYVQVNTDAVEDRTQLPVSKVDANTYWMISSRIGSWSSFHASGDYNNAFILDSPGSLSQIGLGAGYGASTNWGGPLLPEEAWNIDTKIDDGIPGKGRVEAMLDRDETAGGNLCVTSGNSATSVYDLDSDYNECSLIFHTGF